MLGCITKSKNTTNQASRKLDNDYFMMQSLHCNKALDFPVQGETKDVLSIWELNNNKNQLFNLKKVKEAKPLKEKIQNALHIGQKHEVNERHFSTKFSSNKVRGAPKCKCAQNGKCDCKPIDYFYIQCKGNKKYLTTIGLQTGATLAGQHKTGQKNQWFMIQERIPGSQQYFIWSHGGKVLQARNKETENGTPIVLAEFVSGQHQLWKINKPLQKTSSRSSSISSSSSSSKRKKSHQK